MIEVMIHYRLVPTRSCRYSKQHGGYTNSYGGGKRYGNHQSHTQITYNNKHPFNISTEEVL